MGHVASRPHELWSLAVRRRISTSHPGFLERLEKVFNDIPQALRIGPWAWPPTIMVGGLWIFVAACGPRALAHFEPMPPAPALCWRRSAAFLYGASILGYMMKKHGPWGLVSWTMLGWSLATMRYLAGALGLRHLQRVLTFPSIMANSMTFLLWYAAILPGIALLMPQKRRRLLKDFLFTWFMITVHGVNLPFSLADFAWQPVSLEEFDLWSGLVYGLLYLSFYLLILDPIGAHLYFILSPRKWWGAIVYLGIALIGFGISKGCNMAFQPSYSQSESGSSN